MNPAMASALGVATAATAAALVIASGDALADDITVDNTPFVSSASRAEVRSELLQRSGRSRPDSTEWARQYNQQSPYKSSITPAQARADYISARREVSERYGEDSGSNYYYIKRPSPNAATRMGAPAR